MDISSIHNYPGTVTAPTEASSGGPLAQDQRDLIHAVRAINATDLFGQDNELTFILDREIGRAHV